MRRHRQHRQRVEGDDDEGLKLNVTERWEGGPRTHQSKHRERSKRTTDQEDLEFDASHSQLPTHLNDGLPTQQYVGPDVDDHIDEIPSPVLAIARRGVIGNKPRREWNHGCKQAENNPRQRSLELILRLSWPSDNDLLEAPEVKR